LPFDARAKAKSMSAKPYFLPEARFWLIARCRTAATEMETAVSRALQEIRKRDGIKGKQLSEVRITVKVLERGRE
jgi:hypothetical protein